MEIGTNQLKTEELKTISIAAKLIFLGIGFAISFVLLTSFCSYQNSEKLAAVLAFAAISIFIPWVYIMAVAREYNKVIDNNKTLTREIKDVGGKVLDVINDPESSKTENWDVIKSELISSLEKLLDSPKNMILAQEAAKKLTERKRAKISQKVVVDVLTDEYLEQFGISKYQRKKVKDDIKSDISKCLHWLEYSLEGAFQVGVRKLEKSFSSDLDERIGIYTFLLQYIKDTIIPSELPKEQIAVVGEYMDTLIERLKYINEN